MVDEKEVEQRTAEYIDNMPEHLKEGKDPDELWGDVYEMINAQLEYSEQKEQIQEDIDRAKEDPNT